MRFSSNIHLKPYKIQPLGQRNLTTSLKHSCTVNLGSGWRNLERQTATPQQIISTSSHLSPRQYHQSLLYPHTKNTIVAPMSHSEPSTSRPRFHLRPARLSDIPTLTTLFTDVYSNSSLYAYFFPTYKDHIAAHQRTWKVRLYNSILTPTNAVVVAVLPTSEGGETIVGCSIWDRCGPVEPTSEAYKILNTEGWGGLGDGKPHSAWLKDLERQLHSTYNGYRNWLFPNPSRDQQRLAKFLALYKDLNKDVFEKHFPTRWHMDEVVVAPEWQGKGAGRALVEVGMRWAEREEGVCICLATVEGEAVYQRLGWEMGGELEVGGKWYGWRSGWYRGWWFAEDRKMDLEDVERVVCG
ncbi:hypothetical protein BJ508DRAFT_419783 [Ascobolus immersus RN42]|uniref:N-acetyltransferase domain-containing protein n=1 Tax=Ascobolus immersus RN42 TaxID=1160509 RepID=A0A3N4HIG0_ASCIM|nr:hypothetical protein BJ508DRAFT_419783 [Ascobolus immersus RN42]